MSAVTLAARMLGSNGFVDSRLSAPPVLASFLTAPAVTLGGRSHVRRFTRTNPEVERTLPEYGTFYCFDPLSVEAPKIYINTAGTTPYHQTSSSIERV